jgi:hypothetical protein
MLLRFVKNKTKIDKTNIPVKTREKKEGAIGRFIYIFSL